MTCSHWGAGHEVARAVALFLDSEDKWEGNLDKDHSLSSLPLWDPKETQERTRDPACDNQSLPQDVVCSVDLSWDVHSTRGHRCVGTCCQYWGSGLGLLLQVS